MDSADNLADVAIQMPFNTIDCRQEELEQSIDELDISIEDSESVTLKVKSNLELKIQDCLEEFYGLMNNMVDELGLKNSHFAVAHGMHHEDNYSTAADIAKLSCHAMENSYFREIVKNQTHSCPSKEFPEHMYNWENTNQLLKEGYSGIKTGITGSAGPCLSASIKKENFNVVVVVLSCCSMDSRWFEVPKLVNWGVKKILKVQ